MPEKVTYIIGTVVTYYWYGCYSAGIAPYVSPVANGYSDIHVVRTIYMSLYSLTLGHICRFISKGVNI